jgi:hypothetical protein
MHLPLYDLLSAVDSQDGPVRVDMRPALLCAVHLLLSELQRGAGPAAHHAHEDKGGLGVRQLARRQRQSRRYVSSPPALSPSPSPSPAPPPVPAPDVRRHLGAKTRYNLRVVETLVAARVLARLLGLASLLAPSYPNKRFTLREVLAAHAASGEAKGAPSPSLAPGGVRAALERLVGEVERLRPGNLERWGRSGRARSSG